jgi:ubiquinone/menaquinone biosynthesis C-methylase UbiE/DNA-binding HxlR family transcriptional regulator
MNPGTERLLLQFKTLADPVRLRLVALCRRGECSVSELTMAVGQSQPRVSQHLKKLVEAGLLERFRDGKRVYYKVPAADGDAARRLLDMLPDAEPVMLEDAERLGALRAQGESGELVVEVGAAGVSRAVHRLLLELTVTAPVGDLLDIGCGKGRLLKLLASRANRAVGVDIDGQARLAARTDLMLAGLPNCSLRHGDMYRLPFADGEFDTIILDDVLADAGDPVRALQEAKRLLHDNGRLLVLQALRKQPVMALQKSLAEWSRAAGLRLAPARFAPEKSPEWLLCVATRTDSNAAAA